MGGDWIDTKLGDVLTLKRGYDLPTKDRRPGPFPVVSSSGVTGSHDEAKVKAPGVVTGRYGTLGEVHFITQDYWPLNTTLYVKDFKRNDPRFISYFLKGLNFASYNDKSSVPGLNRNHLHTEIVHFPADGAEQRAIASILGAFDDKIELNRQMNHTLETMARAIFKAWFVDFEPVKAKAAGATSFRGMPHEVFDQLPARMTESEFGPVPEGWKIETVNSICEFNYGKALKASNRRHGIVPVYGSNGPVGSHDESLVSGPGIVVGRKGNPGTVVWVPTDFYPIDTTFYITTKESSVWLPYLRYALDELRLGTYGSDSAVPGLNRNMAYGLPVVVPNEDILASFAELFTLYQAMIYANETQSRTLASIRDTLLPKLISGEIRVQEALEGADGG